MPEDDSPFWNEPPSVVDALPADDLPDGAEGTTVVPAFDVELLAYLQRVSNHLRGEDWIRPALDRQVDNMLADCEVLTMRAPMVVVRGDPERLQRLLAALEEAVPVLRRIVALQDDVGFL